MTKVLLTASALAEMDGPYRDLLRDAGFELHLATKPKQLTESELSEEIPGFPAVLAGSEPYTARILEQSPELRVIARVGVGYDGVDVKAATSHGVAVTITPGANHDCVAEHTFSLMLAVAKAVALSTSLLKKGIWQRTGTVPLRGRTLGIVGLGRIGKAVAIRAKAFQMNVIAHETCPDHGFAAQHGIGLVSFEKLLAESDYLSLHVPMGVETRRIINRRSLALMKPGAYLINTARGGLIDEPALYDALQSGRLDGAGLDVFDQEPPGSHPLLSLDNVVATPHLAGIDCQSLLDMALMAARSIVALSRGEWPAEQIVNPDVRTRFRWQ